MCLTDIRLFTSVGIITRLRAERPRNCDRLPTSATDLSLLKYVRTAPRVHHASNSVVPGALSLGLKRLKGEADHWPPSRSDVKDEWNYISIPPCDLMVCTGIALLYSPVTCFFTVTLRRIGRLLIDWCVYKCTGTDMLSRNIGNQLSTYAAQHSRRRRTSTTLRRKPEISHRIIK